MSVIIAIILYLVTVLVFLALDALMLRHVMQPLFARYLGDWMRERPRMGAAAVFYMAYVLGLVWLVSWPALVRGNPGQALIEGMVVGAMAYGTYEFTNFATLKRWSPLQVTLDTCWGTLLTGISACIGVFVARIFV